LRLDSIFLLLCLIAFLSGLFLIILPAEIGFFYQGKAGGHSLLLRFSLLGDRLGVGIRLFFGQSEKGFQFAEKLKIKVAKGARGWEEQDFPSSLGEFMGNFTLYQKFLTYVRKFMQKSFCRSLVWETELGFQDYALTGMSTGMLWAGKGVALGILSRFLKIDPQGMRVQVSPHFGISRLETRLDCILVTRLGHIINTFWHFLIWWIKFVWYKKRREVSRVGGPSDRSAYENCHGEHQRYG
jgi:hypothetical protein